MTSKPIDLVASDWTLAAAARAGFTGFGIWHSDLEHTLRTLDLAQMRRILDDHGMRHIELEFLADWWFRDGARKAACDARKRMLLWHLVNLGIPYADAARIPARFLGGIEIDDGTFTAPWSLHEDTINHRRLCGEGEFDVRGFVATMLDAGYAGPWGIEVLNSRLRTLPPERIAERAATTTRAQFPR
jgi:sugar phosphate isomerase/epimerase